MYHYLESGQDKICLRNGYIEEETAYGQTGAFKDIAASTKASPKSASFAARWKCRKFRLPT
jgi:hypothetical protein